MQQNKNQNRQTLESAQYGLEISFNTTKTGTEKNTGIAFHIFCVTCYEEVTLQLVFAAELVGERVPEKLICILASE